MLGVEVDFNGRAGVCVCEHLAFSSVTLGNDTLDLFVSAVESSLLTMSTHWYRKQFEPKLGVIVHTCAKNFGSCC